MILHAGLIAMWSPAGWRGVLIEGPSGSGKSDLALRALDQGFRLVADDRVVIWKSGGALYGRAPDTLAGRMEVRGLDVVAEPALAFCRIALAVRPGVAERIPAPTRVEHLGLSVPLVILSLLEPSAPDKLARALQHLGGGAEGAYQGACAAGRRRVRAGDSR